MSETITRTDLTNILNEVLPVYNSTGFTVEKITASSATSVSANGGTAWIQVRIPSGYEPVCIVGYYLNGGSGCSVYNEAIAKDSNGYYCSFALRNGQSSVNTVTIDAYVLCKQSLTHFTQAMADYIVEQGTSGIWTYRKWNSGIAECWGTYTDNRSSTQFTSTGNIFYRTVTNLGFPTSLFNSAPTVNLTSNFANAGAISLWDVTASAISFSEVSAVNTARIVYVQIDAKGTWK